MSDDEILDSDPRSAEIVARRALILAAISCRGIVDGDYSFPETPTNVRLTLDWIKELGLVDDLSEWEFQILTSEFGSLSYQDRVNASWLSEGLVVLAWALQLSELPSFDNQCDPRKAGVRVGFMSPKPLTALFHPRLRSVGDLQDFNSFVYNVHWRLRDYSLFRRPYDFRFLAKQAWTPPLLRFGLNLVEDDIGLGGKPLHQADESLRQTLASITQERHRASNWLLGIGSSDFYEVSTDT